MDRVGRIEKQAVLSSMESARAGCSQRLDRRWSWSSRMDRGGAAVGGSPEVVQSSYVSFAVDTDTGRPLVRWS